MGPRLSIRLRRAYEEPARDDGTRVLIDRLWPRGVRREQLRIDRWAKELAPSDELRRWFGHDPERYEEFEARYAAELAPHRPALAELRRIARDGRLTLVFAARDRERCGDGPFPARRAAGEVNGGRVNVRQLLPWRYLRDVHARLRVAE